MTFPQILDRWLRRFSSEFMRIIVPGAAALLLFDVNFGIFQGEFILENAININTVLVYYADKLDGTGTQNIPYYLTVGFIVYLLGYFLYSSSKYFAGPQKIRLFLRAGDSTDLNMAVPPSVITFLGSEANDIPKDGGREICQALVEASGLSGELHALENRSNMFRAFGYLFSLMALIDLSVFIISFDFSGLVIKLCVIILNLVFAFLFFKGQDEASKRWQEQLACEALVAVNRLRR